MRTLPNLTVSRTNALRENDKERKKEPFDARSGKETVRAVVATRFGGGGGPVGGGGDPFGQPPGGTIPFGPILSGQGQSHARPELGLSSA